MVRCAAPGLLGKFITAKGLSQVEASGQLRVPPSALNQYLRGKQRPRADIRQRIARWSGGSVPEGSWLTAKERRGLDGIDAAVSSEADEPPESEKKTKPQKPAA